MYIKTKTFVLFGIILVIQAAVSGVVVRNVLHVGNIQKYIGALDNNLVLIGKIRNQVGRQLMLSLLYTITGEKNYKLRFERSDQAVMRFLAGWNSGYGEGSESSDLLNKYTLFQKKNRRLFKFIEGGNSAQRYRVFNQEILSEFAATEGQALLRFLLEKTRDIYSSYDELLLSAGFFPVGKGHLKEEMKIVRTVYLYFINLNKTFSYINRYLTNSALIFLSGPNPEKFKGSILSVQFDFILHEWEDALRAFPEHDSFLRIEGRSFFDDIEGALLYIQQKMQTVKSKMRDGKTGEATHIFIRSIEAVVDFIMYPTVDSALKESNLLIFRLDTEIERSVSFSRNVTIFLLIVFNVAVLFTAARFLRELNHSLGLILERLRGFSFKKDRLTLDQDEISEIELLMDAKEEEFEDLARRNSIFEKIVDEINVPFFTVSGDFRIERANRAFFSLLGYSQNDLENLELGRILPGSVVFERGEPEDFFIKKSVADGRHTLVDSMGGSVPVLLSSSLISGTGSWSSFRVFAALPLHRAGEPEPRSAAGFLSPEDKESSGLLPVLTEKAAERVEALPGRASESLKYSFRKRRVLIVDDEKTIRDWLQTIVAGHDGTPSVCKNGAEAIVKLKSGTFDLVISDLKMPEVSGYDLGEWLEKESAPMLKRLILITGLRDRALEDYCLKKGCHFLAKPVRSDALFKLAAEITR